MSRLKLVAVIPALAMGLIFVVQNTEVVTVRFLVWDLSMSRVLLLLLMFGLGFFVGLLARFHSPRADR